MITDQSLVIIGHELQVSKLKKLQLGKPFRQV